MAEYPNLYYRKLNTLGVAMDIENVSMHGICVKTCPTQAEAKTQTWFDANASVGVGGAKLISGMQPYGSVALGPICIPDPAVTTGQPVSLFTTLDAAEEELNKRGGEQLKAIG